MRTTAFWLLLTILIVGAGTRAAAQSITLQLSPPGVNFSLNPGAASNPGDRPVTVAISWQDMKRGQSAWMLFAYFDSAVALRPADSTNAATIPASAINATVSGDVASPQTAFTGTCNGTPYCLLIDSDTKVTGHADAGTHNEVLSLSIDLSGALAALPPDTYSGVMHVRMMAY